MSNAFIGHAKSLSELYTFYARLNEPGSPHPLLGKYVYWQYLLSGLLLFLQGMNTSANQMKYQIKRAKNFKKRNNYQLRFLKLI